MSKKQTQTIIQYQDKQTGRYRKNCHYIFKQPWYGEKKKHWIDTGTFLLVILFLRKTLGIIPKSRTSVDP